MESYFNNSYISNLLEFHLKINGDNSIGILRDLNYLSGDFNAFLLEKGRCSKGSGSGYKCDDHISVIAAAFK